MKLIVFLISVVAIIQLSATVIIDLSEVTSELLNSTRYILWQLSNGSIEVEDLLSNITGTAISVNDDSVSFYVYTTENPDDGIQINRSEIYDIVEITGFNLSRPTLVVIHGWRGNVNTSVNVLLRDAIFINNEVNVIVVDWGLIAAQNYLIAQSSVLEVGNYIGDALLALVDEFEYDIDQFTVAGHSLGAHISGNIGARTNGSLKYIVGMDPAGPLFNPLITENRLDTSDAEYVLVIHTNSGLLGYVGDLGHVDYWPNGGSVQPGCTERIGYCSHFRSCYYYAESLYNDNFLSRECESYINYELSLCELTQTSLLGGYPVQEAPVDGDYYLETNSESPFAKG